MIVKRVTVRDLESDVSGTLADSKALVEKLEDAVRTALASVLDLAVAAHLDSMDPETAVLGQVCDEAPKVGQCAHSWPRVKKLVNLRCDTQKVLLHLGSNLLLLVLMTDHIVRGD